MKKGKFTITPDKGSNNSKISVVCEGANSPFIIENKHVISVQGGGITKSCNLTRKGMTLQEWYIQSYLLKGSNPYNVPNILDDTKDKYTSYWYAPKGQTTIVEESHGGHDYYDFGLQEFDTSTQTYTWWVDIDDKQKVYNTNGKIINRISLPLNSTVNLSNPDAQSFRVYISDARIIEGPITGKLDVLPIDIMQLNNNFLVYLGWTIVDYRSHDNLHDLFKIQKTVDGACPILVRMQADRDKTDNACILLLD